MSLQIRINGLEFRYLERYATATTTLSEGSRFFLDYVMSQASALRDHRSAQLDDDVLLMQQGLMCHNLG